MKHRILISRDQRVHPFIFYRSLLRKVIGYALSAENIRLLCEINVLLTSEEGIRAINREMRGVDKPTDVLSFPAFDFIPGAFAVTDDMIDPLSGALPLGDMVLSVDAVRIQAARFGHSPKREACYLVVHSVLHLLGYDHLDEGEQKRRMRDREESILLRLGLTRSSENIRKERR
jgi:probable rRNA maturation factor